MTLHIGFYLLETEDGPSPREPVKTNDGDLCFDIFASGDKFVPNDDRVVIPTGVIFEFPPGWAGILWDRSSTFLKRGLHVHAGKIDSRWREPIGIAAQCMLGAETHSIPDSTRALNRTGQWVRAGERIAQIEFVQVPDIELFRLDQRPESLRPGGWGGSGR